MFGRRPDGREVRSGIDPIIRVLPYIMRRRNDSQVYYKMNIPSEPIDGFIGERRKTNAGLSPMSILIAAYIRAVKEMPTINRFVMNKRIYERNELTVSFIVLKSNTKEHCKETPVKVAFSEDDTIFDVADKVSAAIEKNRSLAASNSTDKLVNILLTMPVIANLGVQTIRVLDRYGLLPKKIIDVSPFHTSLFVSNMASIGMGSIYHHIYNFGTTSGFMGIGRKSKRMRIAADGSIDTESCYPVGVVIDERITSGAQYALFFGILKKYLKNPELLETSPVAETVTAQPESVAAQSEPALLAASVRVGRA